jgi:putative nucleotidyltransferase with HDIG domain
VDFEFPDPDQLSHLRDLARSQEPRVYHPSVSDYWAAFADELLTLPDRTNGRQVADLPMDLRGAIDTRDLLSLTQYQGPLRSQYNQAIQKFIDNLQQHLTTGAAPLVVLPPDQRQEELNTSSSDQNFTRTITLFPATRINVASGTYSAMAELPPELLMQLRALAEPIPAALRPAILELAHTFIQHHPTHQLDLAATEKARDRAADAVLPTDALERFTRNGVIVPRGLIDERDWQLLRAENSAYLSYEENGGFRLVLGNAMVVLALTFVLAGYIIHYQPRIIRNHIRGVALVGLMLAMLLISGLAGTGSGPLYFYGFGIAPTILTALILTIAYDRRFSIGIASIQAVLVAAALNQGVGFFMILLVGLLVACFLLDDVRSRSKLIEVGGASAVAMMVVTTANGLIAMESMSFVLQNTLYAGAAGLAAGFIALGILPFIERIFHITTSMTLLELADVTHPLLKRLAIEAPGTYSHSLQVATLAEAAAEAIGANALACRVGAYYHDVGKLNKSDYFVENQQHGGASRHLNLSPNVSLMIILGHVKDGMDLARLHHLPPIILQFIQQHHGTTLVEYFYKEACRLMEQNSEQVSESNFRYPGPKPKSRETAILMLSDCCESASRALRNHDPAHIEKLVREMALRRLHDGQFDECELTMRDLVQIQRTIIKTLLGIYHGRIAYPADAQPAAATADPNSSTQRKLA